MTKLIVKGLLDDTTGIEGVDWKYAPISEEHMPQVGFGATRDAIRWAYKGYMLELGQTIAQQNKNMAGRPKLAEYQGIDCRRALAIYYHVQLSTPFHERAALTSRALINQMQHFCALGHLPNNLFPAAHATLEASVSRGRTKLEIDKDWASPICEKLLGN